MGFLNKYFDNSQELTYEERIRSKKFFIAEVMVSCMLGSITGGIFITGLAKYLGATDEFNGILGMIPTLAAVVQVLSAMLMERIKTRKPWAVAGCFINRLMLSTMVLIPLFVKDSNLRLAVLAGMFFISSVCVSFVSPACTNWLMGIVPKHERGSFFAIRDPLLNIASALAGLSLGWVLDRYIAMGQEYTGYLITYGVAFVLTIANLLLLLQIKEPKITAEPIKMSIKDVFIIPLSDKKFQKLLVFYLIWTIATAIPAGFFNVYMISTLKLPFIFISIFSICGTFLMFFTYRMWGKICSEHGFAYGCKLSVFMHALIHLFWFFIFGKNAWIMVPIVLVASVFSNSGVGYSTLNLQFQYSPEKGRTAYLGLIATVNGFVGFGCSLIGATIIKTFSGTNLSLFGLPISGFQILFAIGFVLILVCFAYVHFFLREPKPQEEAFDKSIDIANN